MPEKAVAFSSNKAFNDKAPALFGATNAKYMGTHPMSADTFAQTLSTNAEQSHIQAAIAEFEQNPACQRLKQQHGLESIIPLLKVEVLVDGHTFRSGGRLGLQAWRHSHESGTDAQWGVENAYFLRDQWQMLADTLQRAVINSALTINNSGDERQVPVEIKVALEYMTESFEKAYASIQSQAFEELRNESIRVKLARLRHAAVMLAQKAEAGDPESLRTLRNLGSKLDCLTHYAVGPAFDQQEPGPAPVRDELSPVVLPSAADLEGGDYPRNLGNHGPSPSLRPSAK